MKNECKRECALLSSSQHVQVIDPLATKTPLKGTGRYWKDLTSGRT
jgi:hypothetical protein